MRVQGEACSSWRGNRFWAFRVRQCWVSAEGRVCWVNAKDGCVNGDGVQPFRRSMRGSVGVMSGFFLARLR